MEAEKSSVLDILDRRLEDRSFPLQRGCAALDKTRSRSLSRSATHPGVLLWCASWHSSRKVTQTPTQGCFRRVKARLHSVSQLTIGRVALSNRPATRCPYWLLGCGN